MNADEVDSPFADTDADAEPGAETPASTGGGPMNRLFDGNATGPSVDELRMDYGVGREWAISLRGIMRVATGSGVPPAVEIVMGAVMALVGQAQSDGGLSLGGDSSDDRGGLQVVEDAS